MAKLQDFLDSDYSGYDGGDWAMSYHTLSWLQGEVRAEITRLRRKVELGDALAKALRLSYKTESQSAAGKLYNALRAYETAKGDGDA